jgi:hypothetical protein
MCELVDFTDSAMSPACREWWHPFLLLQTPVTSYQIRKKCMRTLRVGWLQFFISLDSRVGLRFRISAVLPELPIYFIDINFLVSAMRLPPLVHFWYLISLFLKYIFILLVNWGWKVPNWGCMYPSIPGRNKLKFFNFFLCFVFQQDLFVFKHLFRTQWLKWVKYNNN